MSPETIGSFIGASFAFGFLLGILFICLCEWIYNRRPKPSHVYIGKPDIACEEINGTWYMVRTETNEIIPDDELSDYYRNALADRNAHPETEMGD